MSLLTQFYNCGTTSSSSGVPASGGPTWQRLTIDGVVHYISGPSNGNTASSTFPTQTSTTTTASYGTLNVTKVESSGAPLVWTTLGSLLSTVQELNIRGLTDTNNDFSVEAGSALTTVTMGSMQMGGGAGNSAVFSNATSLSSVSIGTLAISLTGNVDFSGCALTQASVDNILLAAVLGFSQGGTLNLSGGTNAAPSATGAGYVATLTANGLTVTTN